MPNDNQNDRTSTTTLEEARPPIGDWSPLEAHAALERHVARGDISREDLARLRPWHSTPWRDHECKLGVGDPAPDSHVVLLDGTPTSLHRVFDGDHDDHHHHNHNNNDDRPTTATTTTTTLLVFGCLTCPLFRQKFWARFQAIAAQHPNLRLVLVYLTEAHAIDGGWPLPKANEQHGVQEHQTIRDRIAAAKRFLGLFPKSSNDDDEVVCVVDAMDNPSDTDYEARSSRAYVIHHQKVVYQSRLGPFEISPPSLEKFLAEQQQWAPDAAA